MAAAVVARRIEEHMAKEGGGRGMERVLSAVVCITSVSHKAMQSCNRSIKIGINAGWMEMYV